MTAAALDTPQLEDGPSASVLTGEAAGDPAAAPMLLGGGDKTLRQLDLRKEMRYELDDEIESVSVSDGAVSLVSEAAAAKLVARQVSLTLAEADQKLRRFEVTQDLNDIAIAMFEMLYKRKIYDVKGIVTPMFIVHHSCIIANYRKLASWATSTLQVPETLFNHHLLSAIAAL